MVHEKVAVICFSAAWAEIIIIKRQLKFVKIKIWFEKIIVNSCKTQETMSAVIGQFRCIGRVFDRSV